MASEFAKPLSAFGFLTALEDPQHGFFGGYLVLSDLGRPLEFHCSTPVLPNEAQKILYGPTLRPYVLGEIIGQTLVSKGQLAVQAVITDLDEILTLALFRDEPVLCLDSKETTSADQTPVVSAPTLAMGDHRLFGSSTCTWQAEQLQAALAPLCSHVDLSEPFQRIREAIREAQRISQHPAEQQHDHSAAA
ncbi:MAG: hypothetical protein KDA57_08330 [Planctomycetales bacterium]|nr:hypothetical protein [Planctomycetales bacterium]